MTSTKVSENLFTDTLVDVTSVNFSNKKVNEDENLPNVFLFFYLHLERTNRVNLLVSALDGTTVLHDAVENNHLSVVKLLLKAGGKYREKIRMDY